MPSKESGKLAEVFSSIATNFPTDDNYWLARCVYDQVQQAGTECPGVSIEDTVVSGNGLSVPCKWFRPGGTEQAKHVVLFMHGGGFAFGSPNGHRKLTAHLAAACGCPSLSVDYRLAPEHKYPAAIDDCVAAYKYLLDSGYTANKIIVAGDSCGGGLSTAVPLAAIRHGLPVPGASVSLSPWYDMTSQKGGTMETNKDKDALGTADFVAKLARWYVDGNKVGANYSEPLVSPLSASDKDLSKVPPHWISTGGHDILCDHGQRMAERLKSLGVETVLEVHEGQQHVMEFMAGHAPEAIKSIQGIAKWVKTKVGA